MPDLTTAIESQGFQDPDAAGWMSQSIFAVDVDMDGDGISDVTRKDFNVNGNDGFSSMYPEFEKTETKLENILKYIDDIHNKSYEEKRAFIWGFFYGDGSCGKYNCPTGTKYSWALNQKDYKFCTRLQSLCIDVFGEYFKINNTIKSSKLIKIA